MYSPNTFEIASVEQLRVSSNVVPLDFWLNLTASEISLALLLNEGLRVFYRWKTRTDYLLGLGSGKGISSVPLLK